MKGKVTEDVCRRIHELKKEGMKDAKVAERIGEEFEVDITGSAVYYHAKRRCSHEIGPIQQPEGGDEGVVIEEPRRAEKEEKRFTDYSNGVPTRSRSAVDSSELSDSSESKSGQESDTDGGPTTWRLSEDPPSMEGVGQNDEDESSTIDVEDESSTIDVVGDDDAEMSHQDPGTGKEPINFFELVSNERRRALISVMAEADGPIQMNELATRVAANESGKSPDEMTSKERKRVYVALYQVHLEKIERAGLGEYDKPRGVLYPKPKAARAVHEWTLEAPGAGGDSDQQRLAPAVLAFVGVISAIGLAYAVGISGIALVVSAAVVIGMLALGMYVGQATDQWSPRWPA